MTAMAAVAARRTPRTGVRRERHRVAYPLLVAVSALVEPQAVVEIQAVAYVGAGS